DDGGDRRPAGEGTGEAAGGDRDGREAEARSAPACRDPASRGARARARRGGARPRARARADGSPLVVVGRARRRRRGRRDHGGRPLDGRHRNNPRRLARNASSLTSRMPRSRSQTLRRFASLLILLAAPAGCGKSTQLEAGAVLLDLSAGAGVSTPDELQVSVYDDTGTIWDKRVPESGALKPESATHLGTVLLQPGTTQGALRVHVRALAASARVADGTLSIPAGTRGTFALQLSSDVPADGDGDGVPDAIDDCPGAANERQGGCPGTMDGGGDDGGGDGGGPDGADDAGDVRGAGDAGDAAPGDGGGMDALDCDASGACN